MDKNARSCLIVKLMTPEPIGGHFYIHQIIDMRVGMRLYSHVTSIPTDPWGDVGPERLTVN